MKYLLMLYADEKVGAQIPPEQMVKAMETMYAYRDALTKAGAFVATAALART
ncbi:MAG: YciI family protein [Devosia sp.]